MTMTKFALKEKAVAMFQSALNNAGMQGDWGTEDKPKYWRGFVSKEGTQEKLYLLYQVTDNIELNATDNQSFRRAIYINGSLYTRDGFDYGKYQDLAEAIEQACKEADIILTFEDEGIDTTIDQDSPVSYCNFEAQIRLLME